MRSTLPALLVAAAWLACGLERTMSAQAPALQQRLAAAKTISCTFSALATGTWKDGVPAIDVTAKTLTLKFTNVNLDEGTADADNAFGGSFISVRRSNDYLHLMQVQGAGPLYTTTILAKESKDGRLLAVHTRHEFTDVRLPGYTSRPEMYLGDCAVGS